MARVDPTVSEVLIAAAIERMRDVPGDVPVGVAFERMLHTLLMEYGVSCLSKWMRSQDPVGKVVEADGWTWTRVMQGGRTYESIFGPVRVERGLFRAVRNGPTRCFLEERVGIFDGRWTWEAARLSALLLTDLTSRGAAKFFQEQGGMSPSRTKLEGLPARLQPTMETHREQLEATLRDEYEVPPEAVSVAVSLDGVMVTLLDNNREAARARAAHEGRKAGGPIGSSEASVGSISFYDADGERLMTRRFGRMPEADKATLKETLRRELHRIRQLRPDLVVVAISDGAPNNWSFLESLDPDYQIVDLFHTLEHIKKRLDRALGINTHRNQEAYARFRQLLLYCPDGHEVVFENLVAIERAQGTHRPRKRSGRGAQPNFYERHHHRMDFFGHQRLRLPIGSGVIEGTARHMVVDRLRRTGMRWTIHGGQAVLTLRQFALNDQFNQAWELIMRQDAANNLAHHGVQAAA